MSPAHKQRLIGAIVLLALGLIIVPTVLDFSRDERSDKRGMEIPPGPDAMQMEVLPLDDWSQRVEPNVNSGVDGHEPPADAVESTEPPIPAPEGEATGEIERDAVPAAVPEIKADTPVVVAPASAPVSTPAKTEAASGAGEWVVQVASLTVEAKAIALRDQLRQAGYPALIEPAKGGAIYRVKAGPVSSRAEADDLKKQIKQSTRLDGLVMRNQ
jgi:DedD protein